MGQLFFFRGFFFNILKYKGIICDLILNLKKNFQADAHSRVQVKFVKTPEMKFSFFFTHFSVASHCYAEIAYIYVQYVYVFLH